MPSRRQLGRGLSLPEPTVISNATGANVPIAAIAVNSSQITPAAAREEEPTIVDSQDTAFPITDRTSDDHNQPSEIQLPIGEKIPEFDPERSVGFSYNYFRRDSKSVSVFLTCEKSNAIHMKWNVKTPGSTTAGEFLISDFIIFMMKILL